MYIWGSSAVPKDDAGQASLPSHSQCPSGPDAHWASPNQRAESGQAAGRSCSHWGPYAPTLGSVTETGGDQDPLGANWVRARQCLRHCSVPAPMHPGQAVTLSPSSAKNIPHGISASLSLTRSTGNHTELDSTWLAFWRVPEITLELCAVCVSDEINQGQRVYLRTKQHHHIILGEKYNPMSSLNQNRAQTHQTSSLSNILSLLCLLL